MILRRSPTIIVDTLKARFAKNWVIMGCRYCFGCVLDIRGGEKSRAGAQPVRQSQVNLRSIILEDLATSDPRAPRIAGIRRRRIDFGMNRWGMAGQARTPPTRRGP